MSAPTTRALGSKRAGDRAGSNVIDAVPELAFPPDTEVERADTEVETTIFPRPELPTVALPVVDQGTLVEIESATVRLESGGKGRFYLRREQHEAIVDEAGVYLFVVCEPTPDRTILALKFVAATSFGEIVRSRRRAGPDRPEYTHCAGVGSSTATRSAPALEVIDVATDQEDRDRTAEFEAPAAGERGIPFDAVCTGCGQVRVKRADEDPDDPTSFKRVCHRCKTATWWNPIRTLTELMRQNGHPAVAEESEDQQGGRSS